MNKLLDKQLLNHKLTTIVKSQNILDLLGNEATMVPPGGNNNQTSTSNPAHHDILDLIFDLNPDGASTGGLLMHFVHLFIPDFTFSKINELKFCFYFIWLFVWYTYRKIKHVDWLQEFLFFQPISSHRWYQTQILTYSTPSWEVRALPWLLPLIRISSNQVRTPCLLIPSLEPMTFLGLRQLTMLVGIWIILLSVMTRKYWKILFSVF